MGYQKNWSYMNNREGAPLSSPISLHGNSSRLRALIIAGLSLSFASNKCSPATKQFLKKEIVHTSTMSLVNKLFAPRIDHRGMSTPSEASRIFLILTLIGSGAWAWTATEGNLIVWFSLTLLIATPILSVGWYLLSFIAKNRRGELLTPKVQNALEAKGRWPHHSRKP